MSIYGNSPGIPIRDMHYSGMTPKVVAYLKTMGERMAAVEARLNAGQPTDTPDIDAMDHDGLKDFARSRDWNGDGDDEISLRQNEADLRAAIKHRLNA